MQAVRACGAPADRKKGRKKMLVVTTETITGKEFDMLGLVKGNMVQTKNIGKDIGASFKSIAGGEIRSYTQMMNEAREVATQRMIDDAESLGADAIVCARYSSSAVMQGAAEVIAFGTAVKFRD